MEAAWRTIQENGRVSKSEATRQEIEDFTEDAGSRLRSLGYRLSRGNFKFDKAKGVPIPKRDESGRKTGKFRPIVLAPVESRIVQRALLEVLLDVPALNPFIETPFSFGCLRKKTTQRPSSDKPVLSAVPAAIKGVLNEIEGGARFVACADIKSFFTRISKPIVTDLISSAIDDSEFVAFFQKTIAVELSNLANLRERALDFPIEDIGVAQGNSLSPLLGNIILAQFDREMNEGDCRCIRYVDDFIILAPSAKAANARLRKATALLNALGMELSPEKSSKGAEPVHDGISFLGIEIKPGLIRPSVRSQKRLLASLGEEFSDSRKAFSEVASGKPLKRTRTLIATLKRVDGIVEGWSKHYWFCNDDHVFLRLDEGVRELVRAYLGAYTDIRSRLGSDRKHVLLGIPAMAHIGRDPFPYPKSIEQSILT